LSTARLFDIYAEKYDEWYERHRSLYLSELEAVKLLECRGGLEIGIGSGRFATELGLSCGVDPSYRMLRLVKGGIDLVVGVGEALPFRSDSYPCSLVVVTLCFADDPQQLLREASRVSPRVVACIVPRDSPWGRRYAELGKRGHVFYSHAKFYTVGEVVDMMRGADLEVRGIVATLSRGPDEGEVFDKPVKLHDIRSAEDYGFVCIEAVRRAV